MRKKPRRRRRLFWKKHPARAYDIVRLMPDDLLVGKRFETIEDATRYQKRRIDDLSWYMRHADMVERMKRCTNRHPCAVILCAFCARRYRRCITGFVLKVIRQYPVKLDVVTLLIRKVACRDLAKIDLMRERDNLRTRLERAGCPAAIGGFEVSYKSVPDVWIFHVHLLVFGSTKACRVKLRDLARKDGFDREDDRPFQRKDLVAGTEHCVASYLNKFCTFHRVGKPVKNGKGRPVPLPRAQLARLADLTRQNRFTDSLFLFGFRRRDHAIVPAKKTMEALRKNLTARDAERVRRCDDVTTLYWKGRARALSM
jgi:hypothetical protein